MTFSTIASPGVSIQGGVGSSGSGSASFPISGTGATITASAPLVDGTQTWNNGAVTFTSFKLNITNTASVAASSLLKVQLGGLDRFDIQGSVGRTIVKAPDPNIQGFLIVAGGTNNIASFGTGNAAYPAVAVRSTDAFGWSTGSDSAGGSYDLFLTRRGAANLRFGAADAATSVAQTLSVQSVVAGTANTAGANLTINGSQSTGTGVGGDIIFQVAPAGTAGSTQNALATALRVYNTKTVAVGVAYTVATLPTAGTQGRRAWVTDATAPTFLGALAGGGAVVCPVFDNGTAWVSA